LIFPKEEYNKNMRLILTIKIWREGRHYIAYSPELEVASQGKTPEHALERVKKAIERFLEGTKRMGVTATAFSTE
jgi:predicted RNase H-like HicB family nuclease